MCSNVLVSVGMGDRLLRHIIKQNKPAKICIKTENVTPAKPKTIRGNVEDPKRKKTRKRSRNQI